MEGRADVKFWTFDGQEKATEIEQVRKVGIAVI